MTLGFPTVCALTDWAPLALADSWAMRSRRRASWKHRDRWRRIYEKRESHRSKIIQNHPKVPKPLEQGPGSFCWNTMEHLLRCRIFLLSCFVAIPVDNTRPVQASTLAKQRRNVHVPWPWPWKLERSVSLARHLERSSLRGSMLHRVKGRCRKVCWLPCCGIHCSALFGCISL